jgi:hypothetical protein
MLGVWCKDGHLIVHEWFMPNNHIYRLDQMKLYDEYVFIKWKGLERKWLKPISLYYSSISKFKGQEFYWDAK